MLIVTSPEASYVNGGGVSFYDSSQFSSNEGIQSITATSVPNPTGGRVVTLSGLLSNISGTSASIKVPSEIAAASKQNLPATISSPGFGDRIHSCYIQGSTIHLEYLLTQVGTINLTGCQYRSS